MHRYPGVATSYNGWYGSPSAEMPPHRYITPRLLSNEFLANAIRRFGGMSAVKGGLDTHRRVIKSSFHRLIGAMCVDPIIPGSVNRPPITYRAFNDRSIQDTALNIAVGPAPYATQPAQHTHTHTHTHLNYIVCSIKCALPDTGVTHLPRQSSYQWSCPGTGSSLLNKLQMFPSHCTQPAAFECSHTG